MVRYIGKRLLMMIPVLLGIVLIVVCMHHISSGHPARMLLGVGAADEAIAALEEELGLNDPLYVQFFNYVKGVVTEFDLGTSYQTKRPVIDELMERFPTTAKLAFLSILISAVVGITLGIISAVKQNTILDHLCTSVSLLGVSMPAFWAGMMLILLFSITLKWLPVSGLDGWKNWILPTFTSSMVGMATITRMTRSSMLEVICQEYIVTARAKGLTEKAIIVKHALKNALIPIITVLGIQLLDKRPGQIHGGRNQKPGLPSGTGRRTAAGYGVQSGEPPGGHHLRLCRPAHKVPVQPEQKAFVLSSPAEF